MLFWKISRLLDVILGKIYGWGMGCNKQLAQGDDEDDIYEPKLVTGKQLENK